MTWSVTDAVPPELFPEYEQTVANDTPVVVNEAVLKSPLSRPGVTFTEAQKEMIKEFLVSDDKVSALQWWELLDLDSPEWDYQRGVDELD